MARILALDTHPIQYKAPIYRRLQAAHGHEVTVLYASDFSAKPFQDREFGVELAWDVDLLSGYRALFGSRAEPGEQPDPRALHCRGLAHALWLARPEIVLLSHYAGRFGRESIGKLAGLPLRWIFRGETTDHAEQRSAARAMTRDLALRGFYARCSALAYIGQRSHDHYRRLGVPESKLFFAPYAVETGPFAMEERDRERLRAACRDGLGIGSDQIVLLFSGKLSPRKDPVRLVLAARELPAEMRKRVCILYLGAGELESAIAAEAAREPAIDFRLVGFKNQSALSPYYHAADAVVLSSLRFETWGLVINEALHHGTPCIASDQVGSTPDLIIEGKTGAAFTAGSSASLAAAIQRLWPRLGSVEARVDARAHMRRFSLDAATMGMVRAIDATLDPR